MTPSCLAPTPTVGVGAIDAEHLDGDATPFAVGRHALVRRGLPDERKQLDVDLVLERRAHAVH